jgi:L-arabinose isomerase
LSDLRRRLVRQLSLRDRHFERLSVEMSVKRGPVTLLSVVQTVDGKLKPLTAEGESVAGPILEIGNTNSRYRFPLGARCFLERWNVQGPAHHCAGGRPHLGQAEKAERLARNGLRSGVLTRPTETAVIVLQCETTLSVLCGQ